MMVVSFVMLFPGFCMTIIKIKFIRHAKDQMICQFEFQCEISNSENTCTSCADDSHKFKPRGFPNLTPLFKILVKFNIEPTTYLLFVTHLDLA